jgi:hypothetical protein
VLLLELKESDEKIASTTFEIETVPEEFKL